jgi:hypothetical protein
MVVVITRGKEKREDEMLGMLEADLPVTIEELRISIEVENEVAEFRVLRVDDRHWCAQSAVGNRCIYLRGIGMPIDVIALSTVVIDFAR